MDSDSDIAEPFSDSGSEYRPSSGASTSSSVASSNLSTTIDGSELAEIGEIGEIDEEFAFANGYELKPLAKKSNHKVWDYFGTLFKVNRIVSKTKDRIFCRKCFEKNTIKR